jgi:serine protease
LLVAYNSTDVSDCVRSEQTGEIDQDFYTRAPVTVKKENSSEQEYQSEYTDLSDQVDIKQTSIASNDPSLDQCILLEYQIKNRSAVDLSNVHIGLFTDWDVNSSSNSCLYDLATKSILASDGSTFCGIALVSDHLIQGNCIDNNGTVGSIFPNDGFSPDEKFSSVSNTQLTDLAGKDVSMTMGITLPTLKSQEVKTIAFGLFIGNSLLEIGLEADAARKYYQNRNTPPIQEIPLSAYPNPFNEELTLDLTSLRSKTCTLKLSDLLGQPVFSETILVDSNIRKLKIHNLQEGIYILEIASENKRWRQKIVRTPF